MNKIYLDFGHGGTDGGAQGNGLSEKELNFKIGKKMEALLSQYENLEVKTSRKGNETKSLSQRTQEANEWGADYLISVHINSATNELANGFESYVWNGNVNLKSVALQNVVHQEIMNQIKSHNITDRGKKRANFHMVRESFMPALLTENLFIVNKREAGLLSQDSFLDKLALGHVIGLEKFIGLKKSQQPPKTAQRLYKVQVGAFSSRENADAFAKKVEADGYNTFIVEE